MQVDVSRVYRVKAVAQLLDVSPATIYRAIEAGQLAAYKLGSGTGTLRVPGRAVATYLAKCAGQAMQTQAFRDQTPGDGRASLENIT